MMEKLRDVVGKVKDNSALIGSVLAVSVLGLLGYGYRRREHRQLYKITTQPHSHTDNVGHSDSSHELQQSSQPQQNIDLSTYGIKTFQKIIIHPPKSPSLSGWLIRATIKQRNPKRLIIYYHSQHTKIQDHIGYISILSQYTVSDVLLVEYSHPPQLRTERSMKLDAIAIYEKAKEIVDRQDKFLVVMGKDLGAMLGIYICAQEQYRFMYRLKALIIQNIFSSISNHKTKNLPSGLLKSTLQTLYSLILADHWQSTQNMLKIRIPTMLLLDKIDKHQQDIIFYSLYQGRKVFYEIAENDRIKQQEYRCRNSTRDRSLHLMSENYEDDMGHADGRWEQDIANYFMEIDIFMNNA